MREEKKVMPQFEIRFVRMQADLRQALERSMEEAPWNAGTDRWLTEGEYRYNGKNRG